MAVLCISLYMYINKTCIHDVFSDSPLNMDTMACPFHVHINQVPLYSVVVFRILGCLMLCDGGIFQNGIDHLILIENCVICIK